MKNLYLAKYLLPLFLILITAVAAYAAAKKHKHIPKMENSFTTPDFAYPKTVIANAEKALASSKKSKNYETTVKALIQITLADAQLSEANVDSRVRLCEETAKDLPSPYKQIVYSVEAEILDTYRESSSYFFSSRVVDMENIPESISEWDGKVFDVKVRELLKKSLDSPTALRNVPIAEIQPLLENLSEKQQTYYPSVYELLAYRALRILSSYNDSSDAKVIPFDKKTDEETSSSKNITSTAIYGTLMELHKDEPAPLSVDVINRAENLPYEDRYFYLKRYADMLSDSPYRIGIIRAMYSSINSTSWYDSEIYDDDSFDDDLIEESGYDQASDDKKEKRLKEYYIYANDALGRFPDADYSEELCGILSVITRCRANVTFPTKAVAEKPIELRVENNNYPSLYLLLVKVVNNADGNKTTFTQVMSGKIVDTLHLAYDAAVPFTEERTISFPAQPIGEYAVVPATTPNFEGVPDEYKKNRRNAPLIQVTGLSAIISANRRDNSCNRLYVVSSVNQMPIKDAEVKFRRDDYNHKEVVGRGVSDNDGAVTITYDRHCKAVITKDGDTISTECSIYSNHYKESDISGALFTDLALYHPGDTIHFSGVAYAKLHDNRLTTLKSTDFQVHLLDVNREKRAVCDVTTDADGRFSASFEIPDTGVLGDYRLVLYKKNGAKLISLSTATITVAEYKAPTFFVQLELGDMKDFKVGNDIVVRGKATTYSAMPVADATVKIKINYLEYRFLWWRFYGGGGTESYTREVTTDKNGAFELTLSTKAMVGTKYADAVYAMSANVTAKDGETESSESVFFNFNTKYGIFPSMPTLANTVEAPKTFSVKLYDSVGKEVNAPLHYEVRNMETKELVADGDFTAPAFNYDLNTLPSANYKFIFSFNDGATKHTARAETGIVVWRDKDTTPPYRTPLWLPKDNYVAHKNSSTVEVYVGSSYPDSWILCEVANDTSVVSRKWIRVDNAVAKVAVPAPDSNSRTWVTFSAMRDGEPSVRTVCVKPYTINDRMEVVVASFRDKIRPGDKEIWNFKFKYAGVAAANIPVMAVMSNKALNAIRPFQWSFTPENMLHWYNPLTVNIIQGYYNSIGINEPVGAFNSTTEAERLPELNYYGYGYTVVSRFTMMKSRIYCASAPSGNMKAMSINGAVTSDSELDECETDDFDGAEMVSESNGGNDDGTDTEKMVFRSDELPLAFFQPNLSTDTDGNLSVQFEVPDFNTTWQLQILGYDSSLHSVMKVMETVASKPVMVKLSSPRFLRTNDEVTLCATIFNNSGAETEVGAVMEVFDPVTDMVLESRYFNAVRMDAGASEVVRISFTTPSNEQMLGIRVKALSDNFSDGEQTTISILPSSSPVFEAEPFYMSANQNEYVTKLPKFNNDADVTLQYCDNPVWYCVTALPDIVSGDSDNLCTLIYRYYGNALAAGLVKKFPQVADAVKILATMDDGSALSSLQRDEKLKILALTSTIWTRNAAAETMRISKISELLDSDKAIEAQNSLLEKIKSLQHSDGGFSWFPNGEPSIYMTTTVLLYFGMLKSMSVLQESEEIDAMLRKAVKYCDAKMAEMYESDKTAAGYKITTTASYDLSYLYIRSFFNYAEDSRYSAYHKSVAKRIAKEWRDFSVYNAATAAIFLHRDGDGATAADILRSLKERALVSPTRGMWYDNLDSSFGGWNKLISTTQVLEAFAEVQPESECVNQLRQWLIVQRQTEDWGCDRNISEIIYAILSSGADWTMASNPSVLTINGKPLQPSKRDLLTGEFSIQLNAESASEAELVVKKYGVHPAWGGVMAQYIQPMEDVKQASVDDLSISKSLFILHETTEGLRAERTESFHVGDRVRVMLTITANRDMDYVAITDERVAAVNVIKQLPENTYQEGLWMYMEPRTAQTNIFIPFLSKGTHVISYDCYVTHAGTFSLGIATIQSQYSPMQVAHSAGAVVIVR